MWVRYIFSSRRASFPALSGCVEAIERIGAKVDALEGTHHIFRVPSVDAPEQARLEAAFREQSANEYQELVDECQSVYLTRVEFECFRQNFTYDTAESLRAELERLRDRHARAIEHDFFGANTRAEAEAALDRREQQLAEYEDATYRHTADIYGPES